MPEIKMPQLGESVTEGTISKWLKAPGDAVSKYDALAEIITDKVTAELPSDYDGVMGEIIVPEGETVKVGTILCTLQTEADSAAGAAQSAPSEGPSAKDADAPMTSEGTLAARDGRSSQAAEAHQPVSGSKPRGRFSPAVLRLAEEHQVDLGRVQGTGEGGRITRKDVLAYVESGANQPTDGSSDVLAAGTPAMNDGSSVSEPPASTTSRPAAAGSVGATPGAASTGSSTSTGSGDAEDVTYVQPSAIRRTIARRMVESKRNAPHAWTMVEADVTRLVQLRARNKVEFKRNEGIDLTYLPFFIKAVAESLKQYPMLNASWVDDQIAMHKRIHISIAVATDDSLVVPVIHDADRLSIAGLAHRVNELAAKARSGRLGMDDVQGGTFTVNNTGAFGSILSQPILNAPQSGILSVESIVKRPVVVEGDAIAVRSMVNLCLSLDHRLLDGWVAGSFLKAVRERLESFDDNTLIY